MWRRFVTTLTACGLAVLLLWAADTLNVRTNADPPGRPAAKEPPPAPPAGATPLAGQKLAASRVVSVTVYSNGALVTREVDVPEGAGLQELTITPLPPTTVGGTLHGEGADGIRVMATRYRTRPVLEDTREDVRKLQDELRQLQGSQEKADADLKAAQANLQMLGKLEGFTAATAAHAPDKPGALNAESAVALSKYVMETRGEKSKELVALQQQQQGLTEKMEFARRKLAELAWDPHRTERDAVIVVDKANAAAGKVRVSYLVDEAAWRPEYKVRAGKDAKAPVRLEYLAAVTQHTGEDWGNVELVLSTAQSTLNSAPPDLQVLQVTVVPAGKAPQPGRAAAEELAEQVCNLRAKARQDFNQRKLATGVGLFNTAAALDQSWELLNPEAAIKRGCALATREGPSVSFALAPRLTLPSRAEEQNLEVTRIEMQPDYYYKAVPVLTSHVYRLANLTNKSGHVILPGEATLYVGNDFVGQIQLPLVAVGEPFALGFGVDPQLQVQRQMAGQTRSVEGGSQVVDYKYVLRVSSYKGEPVRMQVWDRLPHAETETVGVTLVKTAPELNASDEAYLREQRPNNLLRWDVEVEPGMNGKKALEIGYEFKMAHDRQMAIA
ncbi:MAG TPA: mucoidy inhibitor MuiA family protein, partial [Gemmataceae bacterium]|nr:mucoidy inhibitor MuiA family protein [Gemmataceae bacterium]